MNIVKCWLIKNDCYTANKRLNPPTKIVVHSTGANNKTIKRYANPVSGQTVGVDMSSSELVKIIGKNAYGNHWNRSGLDACVNAFIGTLADGSLAVCQTLPWNMRAWGVGRGNKGTYNDYAIQFEICEDDRKSASYCKQTYELAAQLCAYLIKLYTNIKTSDIVSHAETHKLGYGSNHGDPDDWWELHGLSMDGFRKRVAAIIAEQNKPAETPKEEEKTSMRYYYFIEVPKWYKPTLQKLIDKKLLAGKGGSGDKLIIDLSEDACRILTILDSAGLFD